MLFLYKIPGYILLLFGGFCLSWGGFIIRSFQEATVWQILLLRSVFFMIALTIFLTATYKKNTIKILKDAGSPAVLGGLVMSLSFIAFVVSMNITTVANVVFIISTQTMFLAIFGYFYLKEKISLISFFSILLALGGITIMVGDSLSTIPINFSILVMIIRKNKNLDMVPAIFYSGIFSIIYGLILSESFVFTSHDILMGFFLGVPQLAFGFICITIGSRTTPSTTIGLLMLTETLFAPIWVWLFLNEIPPASVLIGGTVIITAIILKSSEKQKAPN